MKRIIRIVSFALAVMMLVFLAVPSFTANDNNASESPLSDAVSVAKSVGLSIGNVPSGHGNHQTRIVTVSHGTYFGILYGNQESDDNGSYYPAAIIKADNDNHFSIVLQTKVGASSTTVTIMADKEENIYLGSCWDEGSGFFVNALFKYNDQTKEVTDYTYRSYYNRGNGYGYPVSIMDQKYNCIYNVVVGGDNPGYLAWDVFYIDTGKWLSESTKKICAKKVAGRYCYQYAYPDGNGGFFLSDERDIKTSAAISNLGNRVLEDIKTLHSRRLDAGYMWDEPHIIHVPDATKTDIIDQVIDPAVYDVENGCYPNCTNSENDAILLDNGLFYTVITMHDNGTPGNRKFLAIYDINQVDDNGYYKQIEYKEITFLYGWSETYNQKLYVDTAGNLYIIALNQHGTVEIWLASGSLLDNFTLVRDIKTTWSGISEATICATNRAGSIKTDVAHLITMVNGDWMYYTVDFALIRAEMNA